MFCGLALDQDSQEDLTEGRVKAWLEGLRAEMPVTSKAAAA